MKVKDLILALSLEPPGCEIMVYNMWGGSGPLNQIKIAYDDKEIAKKIHLNYEMKEQE